MKNFWPHRPKASGFSIENLASKYRKKIFKVSSDKSSDQFLEDNNSISNNKDSANIVKSPLNMKIAHWANRDFSEYRDAA